MTKSNNKKNFSGSSSLSTLFSPKKNPDELDDMIHITAKEWYDAKHSSFSGAEIAMVNSLRIRGCPYCKSVHFVRNGHRGDGTVKYKCKACGRQFNPLTGTVFDSRNIPLSEWIEYFIHLCQYQSTRISSLDNRNAYSTGKYWLKKVFIVLRNYQEGIVVGRTFWTDETYLKVMPKDMKRDSGGKLLRGLSKNNICVMTLTDGTSTVLKANGFGKPSKERIKALESHIVEGSKMIDDGERSHSVLAEDKKLDREIHKTSSIKGLPNNKNPMEMINNVHRYFKIFMKSHGSYRRDDIQDWCNLFSFIFNHHTDLQAAVKDFLQLAVSTKKIARYRTLMKKKPRKS